MTRFIKTAAAVAVATLFVGSVHAVVNMETDLGKKTFATELITSGAVFANTGAAAAGVALAGVLDVVTPLGFGVSPGQTRYIRLDLTGATFNAAPNVWIDRLGTITGPVGTYVAVSLSSPNKYIFQITAAPLSNYDQNKLVEILMPSITATGTAAPVLKYQLFEDAPSASNNLVTGQLAMQETEVYGSAFGLAWTLAPASATAEVANLYKTFSTAQTTKVLGTLTYGVNNGVLKPSNGVQVALADLVTAATSVVVTGDFSAFGANKIFLDNDGGVSCTTQSVPGVLSNGNQTATLNIGLLPSAGAGTELCYNVSGTSMIAKQTVANGNPIKAALDVTAAAGSAAADVAAGNVGEIFHDGASLRFNSIRSVSGVSSYIQLANQSVNPTTYQVTCFGYGTGNLTTWAGVGGTIDANNHKVVTTVGMCPSNNNVTAASAVVTVAAPANTVFGTLRRINTTTGVATDVPAQ